MASSRPAAVSVVNEQGKAVMQKASAGGADARTRRRVREAEVEGGSESESEEEGSNSPRRGGVGRDDGQRVAEVEGGSESEAEDEEEIDRRRALLRARAKQRLQEQEVIAPLPADLGFGEDGPRAIAAPLNPAPEAEESEEESSEYESYTDSEEELQPLAKPVFVSKSDRQTIAERDNNFERDDIAYETQEKKQAERKAAARQLAEEQVRTELQLEKEAAALVIESDDGLEEVEFEAWKVRELKRVKRDREEREQMEQEREELERVHAMSEEERAAYFAKNKKKVTNDKDKGQMKFLQKYYHRGAFFMDEQEEVYSRNTNEATLDDHFDKSVLPKVMQVKNFGRSGRTKYTHLRDQDTTDTTSAWAERSKINAKTQAKLGGSKPVFDRPTAKRSRRN